MGEKKQITKKSEEDSKDDEYVKQRLNQIINGPIETQTEYSAADEED